MTRSQRLEKFRAQYLKAVIVDEAHHAAAPSSVTHGCTADMHQGLFAYGLRSRYRHILSHFDPAIKNPDEAFEPPELTHLVPILGFSATFSRHDGLALGSVFEEIVYHKDFLEMIKDEWYAHTQITSHKLTLIARRLCRVLFTTVHADIDLSGVTVNSNSGDFNPTSLAHVINTQPVNELIVRTWLDKGGRYRPVRFDNALN